MAKMLLLNFLLSAYQEVNTHVVNFIQDVNLDAPASSAADGATAQGGSIFANPMFMVIIVIILLMFLMRPRQDKEGEKFRNALQKEQDVVTSSGIFGKIKDVDEVSVTLEVSKGMTIKVDKRYVNPVPTPQPVKPEKPSRRKKKDPSKDEKA
ncbi:MAG: preprotein translocase subunit YajC [Bacteroidaceae bacterium]|nr:preprotein translocase subunit YajC [Bacteroidaceae bacterium]